jgi:hypothetical protein
VTTAGDVTVRVGRTRAGGAATAPLGRYARRQAADVVARQLQQDAAARREN